MERKKGEEIQKNGMKFCKKAQWFVIRNIEKCTKYMKNRYGYSKFVLVNKYKNSSYTKKPHVGFRYKCSALDIELVLSLNIFVWFWNKNARYKALIKNSNMIYKETDPVCCVLTKNCKKKPLTCSKKMQIEIASLLQFNMKRCNVNRNSIKIQFPLK